MAIDEVLLAKSIPLRRLEDDATGDAEVGIKGDGKTMRPLELGGRLNFREEDLRAFCIQPIRLGRVHHVP